MQKALNVLREKLGAEKIDFSELVVLGAEVKARRIRAREASDQAAIKRLAETIRTGSFPYEVDIEASAEVKHLKLISQYE